MSKIDKPNTVLIISGQDYRSKRQVNAHFIARELNHNKQVRLFSIGFSHLSKIKQDPRLSLWECANKVENYYDVECYLWCTFLHPVNLQRLHAGWMEKSWFKNYVDKAPNVLRQWISEANIIIIESGMGIAFFDLIKNINPNAKTIYLTSDSLDTIRCADFLQRELARQASRFDKIIIPSPKLSGEFPKGTKTTFIPHGMDTEFLEDDMESPYTKDINLVSVGSMLFDPTFFDIAASKFPNITFHIIGAGRKANGLEAPNICIHDEMPLSETLPYLKYANAGIAPYDEEKVASYLVDTSFKLMQYSALGLPAICPKVTVGDHKGRFGYTPGDKQSIQKAIQEALDFGHFEGIMPPSWENITAQIIDL